MNRATSHSEVFGGVRVNVHLSAPLHVVGASNVVVVVVVAGPYAICYMLYAIYACDFLYRFFRAQFNK